MDDNSPIAETPLPKANFERRKILIFYSVFFASFLLTLVPVTAVSVFSLMICVCTLAATYSTRVNAEEDGLLENHMTFLIRSFWRANLYLLFTGTVSLIYLFLLADYETFGACIQAMSTAINNGNLERLNSLAYACETLFFDKNYNHLIITAFIAFAPIVGYLLYRCTLGWMHSYHHKLVPDNKL